MTNFRTCCKPLQGLGWVISVLAFCLLILQVAIAQEVTVNGRVSSLRDGSPLPGVSVIIVGTTTGVSTDVDGHYSIPAPMGSTLRFSFVGMRTLDVVVTSATHDVQMEDEATDLEEVVVIGYGVQKKALVTGANQNIKGESVAELRTSTTMEALQGIAPGVNITRVSGEPGAGTRVTIRGMGTIYHSTPLFVVDGVPVGNIDYLNSSDIESIDVLKDAASASIYGSRGANGVIIVTTKQGAKGAKPTISYEAYSGVQNLYKKPGALNAQEYMFIMNEGRLNDGLPVFDWETMIKQNTWLNNNFPGNLGTEYGEYVWNKLQNGWEGTDGVAEIGQPNAPIRSHALNFSGSSQDVSYAGGLSYYNQTGIIGGDVVDAGLKRLTARFNTQMDLLKRNDRSIITIGENFTYNHTVNRLVRTDDIYWNDLHNAIVAHPLMPARWEKEALMKWTNGWAPPLEGVTKNIGNPMSSLFYNNNYNWGADNGITGNVYAIVEPIKNLKVRTAYGLNASFGNSRSWTPIYKLSSTSQNLTDAVSQSVYQYAEQTITNTISYDFRVGEHKIGLLAGNEIIQTRVDLSLGGSKKNTVFQMPSHAFLSNTLAATTLSDLSVYGSDGAAQNTGRLLSFMGRVSYNFRERYMLDATLRRDGSSNFARGHRWGLFPSVSTGWIFTEEEFMSGFEWISFGKLRASWGRNGNNSLPISFPYSSSISYIDRAYYFGSDKIASTDGTALLRTPNPNITWETSQQINFGLDTRFLNSRLGVNFDWYKKKTIDWIVEAPAPAVFGTLPPYINGGDIENKGFELVISWNDNIEDFSYGLTVSGARNKNEVTRLNSATGFIIGNKGALSENTSYVSRVEVGYPVGFFYGYKTNGIFQNQAQIDSYVDRNGNPIIIGGEENTPRRPGDVWFVDQNGDGVINESDKVMLGKPQPDFELGVQLNAEYKGAFVRTTLVGKFGMQVMRSYRSFADLFLQNYTTEIFDRWHGEGTSNRLPRLSATSGANQNNISDIYLHDADFVRISNLTLGYKFDKYLSKVKFMKTAALYLSVNNLYTFTKYTGMDPEIGYGHGQSWASGIDLGQYPLSRTVMMGLNITF